MPTYVTRGFVLRILREALGLTQRQAAASHHIDPTWLSRIETGRLPLSDEWEFRLLRDYRAAPVLRRLRAAIDAVLQLFEARSWPTRLA